MSGNKKGFNGYSEEWLQKHNGKLQPIGENKEKAFSPMGRPNLEKEQIKLAMKLNQTVKGIIGIDPDVHKSGFAIWNREKKEFATIEIISFWNLIAKFDVIRDLEPESKADFHVRIEAAWLHNKSNWHSKSGKIGERIAKNVGSNHQIGKLLAEYCELYEISYELVKPVTSKIKINKFREITKWEGRLTQDSVDAALLVFQH